MRISGLSSSRRTGLASAEFRGRAFCLTFHALHKPSLLSGRPRPAGRVSKPDEWERTHRSAGMHDRGMGYRAGSLDACSSQRAARSSLCSLRGDVSVSGIGIRLQRADASLRGPFLHLVLHFEASGSCARGPGIGLPEALSFACVEVSRDTVRDPAPRPQALPTWRVYFALLPLLLVEGNNSLSRR